MTKKELIDYYKNLINSTGLCPSLKSNYPSIFFELMDLFRNHPEYPEKVRDVIDISITRNKLNSKYFELQIQKANNTTDNISYRCCINKPNKDRNLKSAMRNAIYPQILEFRNNCELSECSICRSKENIQIDHIILFHKLYDDFLKERIDIPTSFDDNVYNMAMFKQENKEFENEWKVYHKKYALLRCLCMKCNLTRKK